MNKNEKQALKAVRKRGEHGYEMKLTLKFLAKEKSLEKVTRHVLKQLNGIFNSFAAKRLPTRYNSSKVDL